MSAYQPEDEAELRETLANARRAWNAVGYLILRSHVLPSDAEEAAKPYDPYVDEWEIYCREYAALWRLKDFTGGVIQKLGTLLGYPPEEIHEWIDPDDLDDGWFDDDDAWFGIDPEEIYDRLDSAPEPKVEGV